MKKNMNKEKRRCFSAMFLLLSIIAFRPADIKAEEDFVLGYYEYDLESKVENYKELDNSDTASNIVLEGSLGTLGAGNETEVEPFSIIGDDNRTLVPNTTIIPTRWVGYLLSYWPNGEVTRGTAWLYGTTVAATAGQCVYSGAKGGYAERIVFYPGYNNGTAPYGSFSATKASVTSQWRNYEDEKYNTGLIKLSSNIGKTLGFFTIRYDDNVSAYLNKSVWITGYPADKGTGMYRMKGSILNCTENNLYYEIDTYDGQEGAPIFFQDPANSEKRICIGLQTGQAYGYGSKNSGVRICKIMCNWMKNTRTEWTQG